jgi:very-short-patch-repair endonuclease
LLPRVDVTLVDAIPVTTPERTFIDIASLVSREQLEEALDDALRRRLVRLVRLRWRLDEVGGNRAGTGILRRLIAARADHPTVPQSVLETKVLRVLRAAGLPAPELQYEVKDRGRLLAVVDFAYLPAKVAIEADGVRWHSSRRSVDHDRARRNRLTKLGWLVVHVTWAELEQHPERFIETVRSTVASAQAARRVGLAPPGTPAV